MIDELVSYNREFVKNKGYEKYITNKYPDKKIAIVSCMDTRLTELLPASSGEVQSFIISGSRLLGHQEWRRENYKERRGDHIPPLRKRYPELDGGDLRAWGCRGNDNRAYRLRSQAHE